MEHRLTPLDFHAIHEHHQTNHLLPRGFSDAVRGSGDQLDANAFSNTSDTVVNESRNPIQRQESRPLYGISRARALRKANDC